MSCVPLGRSMSNVEVPWDLQTNEDDEEIPRYSTRADLAATSATRRRQPSVMKMQPGWSGPCAVDLRECA